MYRGGGRFAGSTATGPVRYVPAMRALGFALLALAALGCEDPAGGRTDTAGASGQDSGAFAPAITSIDPAWDTTAGGAQVTLRGTFRADAAVRVGGAEAELRSVQPETGTLVFYAPPAELPGVVSVVLESGGGTAALTDGFTYYADGTGKIGLVGNVTWEEQVGDYWGVAAFNAGRVSLMPVEPTEFSWTDLYAPAVDTCVSSLDRDDPADLAVRDPGEGSVAHLAADTLALDAVWSPRDLAFVAEDLDDAAMPPAQTWDLTGFTLATAAWPAWSAPALIAPPVAFGVITPAIAGATPPRVAESFPLTWTADAPGDAVFVTLGLYNASASAYQEKVTCWLADDGAFTVPAGLWKGGWAADRQLDLFVSRVILGGAPISFDHSEAAVLGEYQVYGAAFTK